MFCWSLEENRKVVAEEEGLQLSYLVHTLLHLDQHQKYMQPATRRKSNRYCEIEP